MTLRQTISATHRGAEGPRPAAALIPGGLLLLISP